MVLDTIQADLKEAIKAQDVLRLSVLRMLSSEISYKKIDVQRELNDTEVVQVLQKEVKKRREAIEAFTKGNRPEMAQKEQEELVILEKYLPTQMSEEEVQKELEILLANGNFSDFGQAMRVVSGHFKGKADGGLVARLVKEKFS